MWLTKFTEQQQQDYQHQVTWQHPERTVLKSWAMEARDYNTFAMSCLEIAITLIILTTNFITYKALYGPGMELFTIIIVVIGLILMFWLMSTLTRQKKLLIYRITDQGFEVAGWRRAAENIKKIYFGTMIVCGIILLGIVIVVPQAIFMLFIGPVGMALGYIAIGNNKKMWEQERDFRQRSYSWSEIDKIILFRKRRVITLAINVEKRRKNLDCEMVSSIFNIFCTTERYEEIITFVKEKLPNLPFEEDNVEIESLDCS